MATLCFCKHQTSTFGDQWKRNLTSTSVPVLPERPWSWRERGRLAEGTRPCRICGSIICGHLQSHRGRWWCSTLQLEGRVEERHSLGETVTTTQRFILHPGEQSHWGTMFFPLHPGLFVQRKSSMRGDGDTQVGPHTFVVLNCWMRSNVEPRQDGPGFETRGLRTAREHSVVVPHSSQWDVYGNGDCALSSPGEIICSSALQR